MCLVVGAAAGALAAAIRLHAGLPGHKALFWLAPVVAARLISGHVAGATAGACAAAYGRTSITHAHCVDRQEAVGLVSPSAGRSDPTCLT